MKILSVTHSYGNDGAALVLLNTARYWTESMCWQIDALVGRDWAPSTLAAIEAAGMHPVYEVRADAGYDLALVNTLNDHQAVIELHDKLPIVLWVHEAESIIARATLTPAQWMRVFHLPRLTIFNSRWQTHTVFRSFIHRVPSERIAIVPYGILPFDRPVTPRPDTRLSPERAAHGGQRFRVAAVGRINARKGQIDLIEAATALVARHAIECDLIGHPPDDPILKSRIEAIRTRYPDLILSEGEWPRNTALARLAQADAFCLPSHDESYGLAALEAASIGLPVILADLPVYAQVGWVDRENCLLTRAGDCASIGAAIEALIDDPDLRQNLIEGGHRLAAEHDFAVFLDRITNCVEALLA
jgi:glycosyltransferase involved in cell wall biosynthesis